MKGRVFVNSVPKSGTNLLQKLVEEVGYSYSNLGVAETLIRGPFRPLRKIVRARSKDISVGLISEEKVSYKWFASKVASMDEGSYISGHTLYDKHAAEVLSSEGVKMLCIVRHPVSVARSFANYFIRARHVYLYPEFKKLSADEIFELLAHGGHAGKIDVFPLKKMYARLTEWEKYGAQFVRFEDLVGERGGGSKLAQRNALGRIFRYLSLEVTSSQLDVVAERIFGGTHTFSKGSVFDGCQSSVEEGLLRLGGEIYSNYGYDNKSDFQV